jgi:hypothetical protein
MPIIHLFRDKKLVERVKQLEDDLNEIVDVARVSEGPAAAYYGMMAQKALDGPDEQ